jgi:hypothetical protein
MRTHLEYHVLDGSLRSMRLAAVAIVLCGVARASEHAGAQPGEAFTFKFSVGPIEGGRARMSVGLPTQKDGRRLVAVHGQAETSPWLALVARMNDDYQLVLDASTLLPLQVHSIERGIRERTIKSAVNGRVIDLAFVRGREAGRARKIVPSVVRDPLSGLFAVRAAPLADGDRLEMLILDETALWRTSMVVHRDATVRLEGESEARRAIRLDGVNLRIDDSGRPTGLKPRPFTVWLSDDADRVLLRMEAQIDLGLASIELTSYQRGRARAPAPSLPGLTIH